MKVASHLASMPIAAVVYGAMLIMTGNFTGVSTFEAADLCSKRWGWMHEVDK
jgi:uncharacterized membrane protein HdeD (DUF308 family)